jgi:hypothetical protein
VHRETAANFGPEESVESHSHWQAFEAMVDAKRERIDASFQIL